MTLPKIVSENTLTEQAYQTIKKAILNLDLIPGESVSIQQLTDQLGVSRTPIRSALHLLEKEGLLTVTSRKGIIISNLTIKDVEEILELRILLESHAAEIAAHQLTDEELDIAKVLCKEMEDVFGNKSVFEFIAVGHRFHRLILSKVKNQRMFAILEQLDSQYQRIRQYLAHHTEPTMMQNSIKDHNRILEALISRDADKACMAMREHLSKTRQDAIYYLSMNSLSP